MPSVEAVLTRALNLITQVPRHPLRQLLVWYAVVGAVGAVLVDRVPAVRNAVLSESTMMAGQASGVVFPPPINAVAATGDFSVDLMMMIVMLGTLTLTIPVSWGYMAVREQEGFDQSVVQTIVILPIVVAGIMMIVQNNLALAFALAGVSAAVRFRNTLKNVADATFVFLALGLGMAAGIGSLAAAAVMSVIFIFVSVVLWRCNFGLCPTTVAVATSHAPGAPRIPSISATARSGILSVQVSDLAPSRKRLEGVLDTVTKSWTLERTESEEDGGGVAFYRVRLKKSMSAEVVAHEVAMHGGSTVVAAAFDVPAGKRR